MSKVIHFSVKLILTCWFIMWLSCGGDRPQPQEILRPVRYTQVYSSGGVRMRTFSGVAKSGIESNLSFKVAGTVQQLAVKVGDKVRPGQTIARLDPEDYQLKVQQAQAALTQAIAQERNAGADYERVRSLYENNNASKSELDAKRALFESATAQVEAATKQLELARLQLSYTNLVSPTAGSIAAVYVEVNENVTAGKNIVLLTGGSQIDVDVSIPELLIKNIKEGDNVSVTFDAIPGKPYQATVTEVGVAAMTFATTFPVTVRLKDPDPEIRSGMAAEVTFQFQSTDQRERILVPPVAVTEDEQGRFVFVVEPADSGTGIVHRRNVQIGELAAEGLEVFSGLADGELVVTAGLSKIQDGLKVKLQ
ncbi:MAG TPA: efflux RND transporter periplasmic adaptor subunit [bacterium]